MKDAIKPGYLNIWTKPFTKELLTDYLNSVREKNIEVNTSTYKELAYKQIESDIELGVKSPNYYACAFKNAADQDNRINKLKNMKPGLRETGDKKIIKIGS